MKNAIHGTAALAFLFATVSPAAQDTPQVSTARSSSESPSTHFKGRTFTPHVGISARTSDPGEVALQRNPGANLNTNFLIATALTVAPAANIEMGTSLLYWFSPLHDWNALAKIGVYRSDELDIALGAAASEWMIETNRLSIQSTSLGVNWKPRNSRVWWGLVGGATRSV